MTAAPRPPAGAVARDPRRLDRDRGEVARWRHADQLPALEVSLRAPGAHAGGELVAATVTVSTFPGPLAGVTDPGELRQCAWALLEAARWLERAGENREPRTEDPDPQLSIYDHLATAGGPT